ncbi:MAG: protein kinase domain-containing protein [Acidobacteriota bacterium]
MEKSSADRWNRIQEIFHAAAELSGSERMELITRECGDDAELRWEVESLLNSKPLISGVFYNGILSAMKEETEEAERVGQHLAHYRIVSLLGRGGMGLVYLAEDVNLKRQVAIKFLPAAYQLDHYRVTRFREEAYNASRTNHPNIVTIYEIGQEAEQHFIAMEFVEGETLRTRLGRREIGGGDLELSLRIAVQVAEALRAAHRVGVIHRDLKPENIMINQDGLVKILDFGLAKLLEEPLNEPPRLLDAFSGGTVGGSVGTLEYMAPEQMARSNIDRRVDIYSFGILLHELVTGSRPVRNLAGKNVAKGGAESQPSPISPIKKIIDKCLKTSPDERYTSADELLTDLRRVQERVRRESSNWYRGAMYLAAAIPVLLILGLLGHQVYRRVTKFPFRDSQSTQIAIQQPFELATISPDGRYLVYISHEQSLFNIWVRDLETNTERKLHHPSRNGYLWPVITPDNRFIYISTIKALEGVKLGNQLLRISLQSGTVEELLDGVDSPVSFSPDGQSLAYVSEQKGNNKGRSILYTADRDGRNPQEIISRITPEFYTLDGPVWSPDGRTIAITAGTVQKPLYYNVVGVDVQTGQERPLTNRQWGHVLGLEWMPDSIGMVLSGKIRGTVPNHHLHYLDTRTGEDQQFSFDDYDYFGNPSLARVPQRSRQERLRLLTIRRQIHTTFWFTSTERANEFDSYTTEVLQDGYEGIGLGPGGMILYSSRVGDDENIWMTDLKGQKWKLTNNRESNRDPVVAPDGRVVVFSSSLRGNPQIYRIGIDGKNQVELTTGRLDNEPEISPDGQWVVYSGEASQKRTVWRVPLAGGEPEQLTKLATESPVISPDGDWIACLYNEDKVPGKVAIIPAEGGDPVQFLILPRPNYPRYNYFRWSPDGEALDYISLQDNAANIWRQPLNGAAPYKLTNFTGQTISDFEWSADGQRLYCVRSKITYELIRKDQ